MDVRTIITEACQRANIVPRRQAANGSIVETAFRLLQGIVSEYNNDNYLAFTQNSIDLPAKSIIHIYDTVDTYGGEDNVYFDDLEQKNDNPPTQEQVDADTWAMVKGHETTVWKATNIGGTLGWYRNPNYDQFDPRYQEMVRYINAYHVKVKDVVKLSTLMVTNNVDAERYSVKLAFVPKAEFARFPNNDMAWTWTQLAEGEWVVEVKKRISDTVRKLTLAYNKGFRFDLDSDLRLPDVYIELLIVALTHKLAVTYPRLDDAQMQRLQGELDKILDNVRTPKADARQVLRNTGDYDWAGTWSGVVCGDYLR